MCASPCQNGKYGLQCKENCECYNGALCDHITGKCTCTPGYQGEFVSCSLDNSIYTYK